MATFQPISTDQEAPFGAVHRNGDDWPNSGYDFMFIRNARVSDIVVTITGQGRCSMGETHSKSYTVTAGFTRQLGPFDRHQFNTPTGYAQFQCFESDGTTLLPDDDGQGHPDDVGVIISRLFIAE